MRKFMQKPWPLFSCSPQCGIVNWIYVSKDGKMFPINRFVNFDRFFNSIRKTAENAESKGKILFAFITVYGVDAVNGHVLSHQRSRHADFDELNYADASFAVLPVAWKNPQKNLSAWLHGVHGFIQL